MYLLLYSSYYEVDQNLARNDGKAFSIGGGEAS